MKPPNPKKKKISKSTQFERMGELVMKALSNVPGSKVIHNHKIEDRNGILRQFDVFVYTVVNNIPINIAIESKDYNSNISIDKIDAFDGKCNEFPTQIHGKIMITATGFQKGARELAIAKGIDLYTLSSFTASNIEGSNGIINLMRMYPQIALLLNTTKIIDDDSILEIANGDEFDKIYLYEGKNTISLYSYIEKTIHDNFNEIRDLLISNSVENGKFTGFTVVNEMKLTNYKYTYVTEEKKELMQIKISIMVRPIISDEPIKSINVYRNEKTLTDEALIMTTHPNPLGELSFVQKAGTTEVEGFIKNENGEIVQMKTIMLGKTKMYTADLKNE